MPSLLGAEMSSNLQDQDKLLRDEMLFDTAQQCNSNPHSPSVRKHSTGAMATV